MNVWRGNKPSLKNLNIFGCDASEHVPKENMSKLDKKVEKSIFIGCKHGLKGYKLWNLETKKFIYRKDIVFKEIKDVFKHEFLPNGRKN